MSVIRKSLMIFPRDITFGFTRHASVV